MNYHDSMKGTASREDIVTYAKELQCCLSEFQDMVMRIETLHKRADNWENITNSKFVEKEFEFLHQSVKLMSIHVEYLDDVLKSTPIQIEDPPHWLKIPSL